MLLIKRAYGIDFCHVPPRRPKIDVFFVRGILGESCAKEQLMFLIFCGTNDFHSLVGSAVASYIALRRKLC